MWVWENTCMNLYYISPIYIYIYDSFESDDDLVLPDYHIYRDLTVFECLNVQISLSPASFTYVCVYVDNTPLLSLSLYILSCTLE